MADSTLTDLRTPTSARISLESVRESAEALIKWKSTKSLSENPNLLADEEYFYLILTLKKIPPKGRVNPYKISLPHPLHLASDTELCLIIDDREKSKLTKADAKKKIEADEIGVGKILRLTKLKTDYHAFEAKRKLCDSYDMFLVDKRIIPIMPKLLGKQFFKKKKIPIAIDLTHKNWKEQIGRAIGSGLLYLRTGTCSVVKVARVSMDVDEIVENVMAAVNGIVEIVPKKWDGVRSLHLKLSESLSLPIYQALPDLKLKISRVESVEVEEVVDEEVGIDDSKKNENVIKKKSSKKGKILVDEQDDLAENDNVGSEDDEPVVEDSPVKKRKKSSDKVEKAVSQKKAKKNVSSRKKDGGQKKKKVSSETDEDIVEKRLTNEIKKVKNVNVESEDDEPVVEDSPVKKRKKSSDKLEKAVSKKKAKNNVSSRKNDGCQKKKKGSSEADEDTVKKRLTNEVKKVKNDNVEDAKDNVAAKKNSMKKLKTEGTNLKDKKRSRTAK